MTFCDGAVLFISALAILTAKYENMTWRWFGYYTTPVQLFLRKELSPSFPSGSFHPDVCPLEGSETSQTRKTWPDLAP